MKIDGRRCPLLLFLILLLAFPGLAGGDDDDDQEVAFFGSIEFLPTGLRGDWRVSDQVVSVVGSTELEADEGPFVVGACVQVAGIVLENGRIRAKEIQTEDANKCRDASPQFFELRFLGLPAIAGPAEQLPLELVLNSPAPRAMEGEVSLGFESQATIPATDPAIQFSTGGTRVRFTLPAGATRARFPTETLAFQTGTVAGQIALRALVDDRGANQPRVATSEASLAVMPSAPVIRDVRVVTTQGGLHVELTALSTPRDLVHATFRFAPAAGGNLETTQFVVPLENPAKRWFESGNSAVFGSLFTLTQPFSVSGDIRAIGSVSVTLTNSRGESQPISRAL